jgi:hypothetical protein
MNAIKTGIMIIQFALGLLPSILETVQLIERPGNGIDKSAAVINLVKAAFELLPDDLKGLIAGDKIAAFTAKAIDVLVGFLNKVGIFPK